ncbi:MAG: SGNH/GDSL hydrolase family protein [Angelakisella sp.]
MKSIAEADRRLQVETNLSLPGVVFRNADAPPFVLYGAAPPDGEHRYQRLPSGVARGVSEGVQLLATHTAGLRLRFSTDSAYVAIKVRRVGCEPMSHMALAGQAGFDLYADYANGSAFVGTFFPDSGRADCYEAVVRLPDRQLRNYTLNFPLYSPVLELLVGLEEAATVGAGASYKNQPPIVYYGSSITQGGCASRPGNAYQSIIARQNGIDYRNLGFSGGAKGEDAMVDYLMVQPMSALVCDYDHNAETVELLERTHYRLYSRVRAQAPGLPIVLVSRPNFCADSREDILRRAVIHNTYLRGVTAGDQKLWYLDGGRLFDSDYADCSTVDGCHPNDFGFVHMAKGIGAVLRQALAEPDGRNDTKL